MCVCGRAVLSQPRRWVRQQPGAAERHGVVQRSSLVQLCFSILLQCWIPLGSVQWVQGMEQESPLGLDADANPLCPGEGATSLLSASLIYGAECLRHGKSPWEQLWHFTAAPALDVITLLAFRLLSGPDEHPSELSSGEMSRHGPATRSRGIPGMGTACASTLKPFPPGSCCTLAHCGVCWDMGCISPRPQ